MCFRASISRCRSHLDSGAALTRASGSRPQSQEIGSTTADLQPGSNVVDLDARISQSGVSLMEVHVSSAGAEQVLVSQAMTVRRPRVLVHCGRQRNVRSACCETLKRADSRRGNGDGFSVVSRDRIGMPSCWTIIPTTILPRTKIGAGTICLCRRRADFHRGRQQCQAGAGTRNAFRENVAGARRTAAGEAHGGRPGAGQIGQHERRRKSRWPAMPRAPASARCAPSTYRGHFVR